MKLCKFTNVIARSKTNPVEQIISQNKDAYFRLTNINENR